MRETESTGYCSHLARRWSSGCDRGAGFAWRSEKSGAENVFTNYLHPLHRLDSPRREAISKVACGGEIVKELVRLAAPQLMTLLRSKVNVKTSVVHRFRPLPVVDAILIPLFAVLAETFT